MVATVNKICLGVQISVVIFSRSQLLIKFIHVMSCTQRELECYEFI